MKKKDLLKFLEDALPEEMPLVAIEMTVHLSEDELQHLAAGLHDAIKPGNVMSQGNATVKFDGHFSEMFLVTWSVKA